MNDLIQNIHKASQGLFQSENGIALNESKLKQLSEIYQSNIEQLGLVHYEYYEHYKALILSLGLKISLLQKAALIDTTQNKTRLPLSPNQVHFYELLLASYVIHRCYEQLYFFYLNSHYDHLYDRLLISGIALHFYIQTYLPVEYTERIFAQLGLPLKQDPLYQHLQFKNLHPFSSIYQFDSVMPIINLWRLLIARLRRLILNLQVCLRSEFLGQYIGMMEPMFGQVMSWVNFIYFIPRLVFDLANLLYHLFILNSQDPKAQSLSLQGRFWLVFNRRWESVLRDLLWLTNNFLSLFILTGTLGFASFYVNAFVQFLETLLNLYLMYDFEEREKVILITVNEINKSFGDEEKHALFQELNYRWSVDDRIREIRFYNSLGVLLSFILTLPCMATISPVIPLMGAVLGVIMSFIQFNSLGKFSSLRAGISDPLTLKKMPSHLQIANSLNLMTSN